MDKIYSKELSKKNEWISNIDMLAIKQLDNSDDITPDLYKDPELKLAVANELKRRYIVDIKYAMKKMNMEEHKKFIRDVGFKVERGDYVEKFLKMLNEQSYTTVKKIKKGL
mgnify:CR=1 FL=1|jgi:hypothetical protein